MFRDIPVRFPVLIKNGKLTAAHYSDIDIDIDQWPNMNNNVVKLGITLSV